MNTNLAGMCSVRARHERKTLKCLDRVLALDTMAINVIALITLWGIRTASAISFEAALLFAMTGFVGTVAYAKFVLRGDVIE